MTRLGQLAHAYVTLDHIQSHVLDDRDAFSLAYDTTQALVKDIQGEIGTEFWKLESFLERIVMYADDSPSTRYTIRQMIEEVK